MKVFLIAFLLYIPSAFADKGYNLKHESVSARLYPLEDKKQFKPFRADFIKLSPILDNQKPLASIDYAGWIFSSGLLIGSLNESEIVGVSLAKQQVEWKINIAGGLTVPPAGFGSWIFFATRSGYVYKINALSGEVLWRSRLDSFVNRPIVKAGSSLLLITSSQTLYHLDSETGQMLWAFDTSFNDTLTLRGQAAPLIVNNVVYFGIASGEIIAVNIGSGKQIWRINPNHSSAEFKDIMGELTYYDGKLIFARYDGTIGTLVTNDPHNTLYLWEDGKQVSNITCSAFRSGKFYVGTTNGHVLAYFPNTGKLLWDTHLGVSISNLTVGEQQLYTAGSSGFVTALDINSGNLHWYDELGSNITSPPIYKDKEIYFATGNKNLYGYKIFF